MCLLWPTFGPTRSAPRQETNCTQRGGRHSGPPRSTSQPINRKKRRGSWRPREATTDDLWLGAASRKWTSSGGAILIKRVLLTWPGCLPSGSWKKSCLVVVVFIKLAWLASCALTGGRKLEAAAAHETPASMTTMASSLCCESCRFLFLARTWLILIVHLSDTCNLLLLVVVVLVAQAASTCRLVAFHPLLSTLPPDDRRLVAKLVRLSGEYNRLFDWI